MGPADACDPGGRPGDGGPWSTWRCPGMRPGSPRPAWPWPRWRPGVPGPGAGHRARIARETAVVLALFGLWQLVGTFVLMGPERAVNRGQWIWQAERAVHLPSETAVQAGVPASSADRAGAQPLLRRAPLRGGHRLPDLGVRLAPRHYPQVRTTLVLFTAAALLVQFIPVAPPRMLPGDGMIDTAAALRAVGLRLGGRVQRRSAVGDAVGACRVGAAGRPGDRRGVAEPLALARARLPAADHAGRGRHREPLLAGRDRRGAAARAGARGPEGSVRCTGAAAAGAGRISPRISARRSSPRPAPPRRDGRRPGAPAAPPAAPGRRWRNGSMASGQRG